MQFSLRCSKIVALLSLLLIASLYTPATLFAIGHPSLVKDINPSGNAVDPYLVNPFAPLSSAIIFAANDGALGIELWKSDGTPEGTQLVKDIYSGSASSTPYSLTPVNGKVVFRASDPVNGSELWVTDGTPSGTLLLADLYPGITGSWPQKFTVVGNTLYFVATTTSGNKLWKTDGTQTGTMPATEFTPTGGMTSFDSLVARNGKLLVVTVLSSITQTWTIWSVDPVAGTSERVATLLSQPKNVTPCGNTIFFSLTTGTSGEELWASDGTESGTAMVKEINPSGSASPGPGACVASILYFAATEPATGTELWRSDGTGNGTLMVKDISSGTGSSNPWKLRPFNGKLLLRAAGAGTGAELWISDGTDSGTQLVKDINPGGTGSVTLDYLAVAGNRALFSGYDVVHGDEVWVTDGTLENTFMLADLNPGSGSATPQNFTVLGNTLYFSAYDANVHYNLFVAQLAAAPHSLIISPLTGTSFATAPPITGEAHSDTGSPINLVEVSTDGGLSWVPATGTAPWNYSWPPAADGVYSLLSRATDEAGAVETPGPPVQVTIDTTPPAGWVIMNNDAATTSSTQVNLSIHAEAMDPGLDCALVTGPAVCGTVSARYSHDGIAWTGWGGAVSSRVWNMATGDGEKTVYVELKDRAGNTALLSDTIVLDTGQVPISTIISPLDGFNTRMPEVFVSGTAAPGPGGGTVTQVEVSGNGGTTWQVANGTTSWSIDLPFTLEGRYTIMSRARTSSLVGVSSAINVRIDRTSPTGGLSLYNGEWTLNARDTVPGEVCLMVYPNVCGYIDMSKDGGATWEPASTKPGTPGPLWLRDRAGNLSYVPVGTYDNSYGGPIQLARSTPVYYSFLQHAYDASLAGDVIKLASGLAENLTLSRSTSLTIRGGYTGSFGTVTGCTPVSGNLTMQAGSAVVENIDLSGTMTVEGGELTVSGVSVL